MPRYHVNQKTGQPGPCRAKHSCPFGDLEREHYDSQDAARKAYESTMQPHIFLPKKKKPIAGIAIALVATFSLVGCKAPDISLPDVNVPQIPSVSSSPQQESPTATPTPSATSGSETPTKVKEILDKLNTLEVKGRAPKTGYDRNKFMTSSQWDKARQATLKRDLTDITLKSDGNVYSGTLVKDPYTGKTILYVRGGASEIDVDHVVALGNAWESGIQYKDAGTRLALATDPDNLLSVDSSANRQKGDANAASWLPANKEYRCTYVSKQILVKAKYNLSVTAPEKDAMTKVVNENC